MQRVASPVQACACREYGIVGNVTDALSKQAPTGVSAPLLAGALRLVTRRNKESQTAALRGGAVDAGISMLEAHAAQWSHMQALLLLQELVRDNPAVKDAVLKQGITVLATCVHCMQPVPLVWRFSAQFWWQVGWVQWSNSSQRTRVNC